jgi:D-alanyl-D-alanine carboxypeptidase (penicillin-binding protein 5/6)
MIRRLFLLLMFVVPNALAQEVLPAPPQIDGSAYLLIDFDTNKVLAESNVDEQLPPASLTKIMTSYLAAQEIEAGRISLTDNVPISVKAWKAPGSRMFIREGTTVPLHDLLKGIIIQSGNDASVAVAEYVAGSESAFADMMNQRQTTSPHHGTWRC